MVRVLLCHYFKAQRVFSETYHPTSLHASRQFIFVGIGGCRVFVHSLDLPDFPLVCQFSTISTSVKLVSNEVGHYVATVERRQQKDASTYARVYFNWDKGSTSEAVRVVVAGYSIYQRSTDFNQQFLAVELPSRTSVTALACCKSTGNVVVACDMKLCVYRLCTSASSKQETKLGNSPDLEHLLDIDPGFIVRGIDISDHFVAFRSKLEVRTIKLVFTQQNKSQFQRKKSSHINEVVHRNTSSERCEAIVDNSCVEWEFDGAAKTFPNVRTDFSTNGDEVLFRTVRAESTYFDTFLEPKEVLGPVTELKGHPLKVVFAGRFGVGISVEKKVGNVVGVTMLYRRFRAEQLCNSDSGTRALHSLQLLPTYAQGLSPSEDVLNSPLVPCSRVQPQLCGMCVLVSGPKEGFIYDVYSKSSMLSLYKYTCDTLKVTACHTLLHAITKQGLETYTVRMFAAASHSVRQRRYQKTELCVESQAGIENAELRKKQAIFEKGSEIDHKNCLSTSQIDDPQRLTEFENLDRSREKEHENESAEKLDLPLGHGSLEDSRTSKIKEHSVLPRTLQVGLGPLDASQRSAEGKFPSLSAKDWSSHQQDMNEQCPSKEWTSLLPTHELDCLKQVNDGRKRNTVTVHALLHSNHRE